MNNIRVANHNAAVHIQNGVVTSLTSSFSNKGSNFKEPVINTEVIVSLAEAIKTAENALGGTKDSFEATLGLLEIAHGELAFVHSFQVRNQEEIKWYHVSVDAQNGT
jgi:extracellular elastinolytic metalloproteinase